MSTPNAPIGFAIDCPAPARNAGLTVQTLGPQLRLGTTWFDHNFYRNPVAGQSVQNADGSVFLPIAGNGYGICTAREVNAALGTWVGRAFKPPFYVEAELSFIPSASPGAHWPSFWANPIEAMSTVNAPVSGVQWPGQVAGFLDTVEFDFFELDLSATDRYGICAHNWYGIHTATSNPDVRTPNSSVIITPAQFTAPNRFGFLIVPGSARWYFNGVQVGPVANWTPYNATLLPPPVLGGSAFSRAELFHYSPIINTSDLCPLTVHSMSVWQATVANNLIY